VNQRGNRYAAQETDYHASYREDTATRLELGAPLEFQSRQHILGQHRALALIYECSYSGRYEGGVLRWHGREELPAFPESARRRAGYELFMVQVGHEPADFKPMPSVGPGACEIGVRDEAGTFE